MNRTERLPLALSLLLAAGLMGWIVWTQRPVEPVDTAQASAPVQAPPIPTPPAAPPVDEVRAAELREAAEGAPEDVQVRMDLGKLYFDAQRFEDAIPWYEAALALRPEAVDVSTDLGVAYFYLDDTDRALEQFARSLEVDPEHPKTILNLGIVLAIGKQDLDGALAAWEQVQQVAPDSPEARDAAAAIASISAAHP